MDDVSGGSAVGGGTRGNGVPGYGRSLVPTRGTGPGYPSNGSKPLNLGKSKGNPEIH